MKLLLVDNDEARATDLSKRFAQDEFEVEIGATPKQAQELASERDYPLVVADLNICQADHFGLIRACQRRNPNTLVILMTGVGSLEEAIDAVSSGAYDYISRPFDLEDLALIVRKARFRWEALSKKAVKTPQASPPAVAPKVLVGKSRKMLEVYRSVAKAIRTNGNVLIKGETGTGKELVARAIHANSPRKSKRFLAINCAALTDTLLESELFGHVRGAFTGAHQNKKGFFSALQTSGSFTMMQAGGF